MIIYISLVVFLLIVSLYKKFKLWPVFLILLFISVFRNVTVGIDYESHLESFLYELSIELLPILIYKYEFGWIILNVLIKDTVDSFSFVIFFTSLLTILCVFYVIKKECVSPVLGITLFVLLFYYFISFSLIRQGAAVSLIFLATHFFYNGNLKSFYIFFILAIMFHYSSVLTLPIIFLAKKTDSNKIIKTIAILGSYVFGFLGIGFFFRDLLAYLPYVKYANYAESYSGIEINILNTYLFLIPQNLIFILLIWTGKVKNNNIYLNMFFFGLVLNNLLTVIPMISRFVVHLNIFEIILLCNFVFNNKFKGSSRISTSFAVIIYALIFFTYNLITNRAGIVPYKFIF